MGKYSEYEVQNLLRTPIPVVMEYFGKDARPRQRNKYLSPLRNETNPSFCVNPNSNTWYDFGVSEGGGVIDLVCRLSGCRRYEALDILSVINGRYTHIANELPRPLPAPNKKPQAVIIEHVSQSFTNKTIIQYAASRGISKVILDHNCMQVCYHLQSTPRWSITAIGFMNDLGGYALRSTKSKISSSSYISTIRGSDRTYASVLVFEGFFDYLSFLALNKTTSLEESVCVLNGVGNVNHALKCLEGYTDIRLYLDNDDAGRRCRDTIMSHFKGTFVGEIRRNVCDYSITYAGHKDLNSMLCECIGNAQPSNHKSYEHDIIKGNPAEAGQDQLG